MVVQDVDIVYIGTPHTGHYEYALAALQAGKHVLCEKVCHRICSLVHPNLVISLSVSMLLKQSLCSTLRDPRIYSLWKVSIKWD